MKTQTNTFFNPSVDRAEVAFKNYLDEAVEKHPLPWRACLVKNIWTVVASDNVTVVIGCADWAQARAIVSCMQDNLTVDAPSTPTAA